METKSITFAEYLLLICGQCQYSRMAATICIGSCTAMPLCTIGGCAELMEAYDELRQESKKP